MLEKYKNIEKLEVKVKTLDKKVSSLVQVKEKDNTLNNLESEIKKQEEIHKKYQSVDDWMVKLDKIKQKRTEYESFKEKVQTTNQLRSDLDNYNRSIKQSEKEIKSLKHITEAEQKLNALNQKVAQLKQAQPLARHLTTITTEGVKEKDKIVEHSEENKRLIQDYQAVLKKIGACPVCKSSVDETIITQIATSYQL